MGSHTYLRFSVLCLFMFALANANGLNVISPKTTGINAVDRQFFRVINGEEAPSSTVAVLANLIIIAKREGFEDTEISCTGTVLNRRWLLTAAHCFFVPGGFQISIQDSYAFIGQADATLRIGNTDIEPYRFRSYLTHKDFLPNRVELGNDIALIMLNRLLPRNTARVNLSRRRVDDPQPVVSVEAAGYGLVDNPFTPDVKFLAETAMQASITMETFDECKSRSPSQLANAIDENELICTVPGQNSNGENTDICSGDSGGPLFTMASGQRLFQFGITSFATTLECAADNTVSYYTRVSNYRRTIREGLRRNFASWNVVNA